MKKIIAIILALVMVMGATFALSSCQSKEDNTLVCGVTIIPGLNEKDENGNWTGFESEFAMAVGEIIGMDVEFKQIDWENKYFELESGKIDCIWNGFTANAAESDGQQRSSLVDFSYGYMPLHPVRKRRPRCSFQLLPSYLREMLRRYSLLSSPA